MFSEEAIATACVTHFDDTPDGRPACGNKGDVYVTTITSDVTCRQCLAYLADFPPPPPDDA